MFVYLLIYLFVLCLRLTSAMLKFDVAYKELIDVNNNTSYISVNKLSNNNENNKTKYLIIRRNQHAANRLYVTNMDNQASTFLSLVWKILYYHNFLLFREQVAIFLGLFKIWFWYHILQTLDLYFEESFVF